MTKTEALILLADALREANRARDLKYLNANLTLAIIRHGEGKMTDADFIEYVKQLNRYPQGEAP